MSLAEIQKTAQEGNIKLAEKMLADFLHQLFGFKIENLHIREDRLSLNSVNGIVYFLEPEKKAGLRQLFFKFHHEENEEGLKEYYNSRLLADNGFPVEMPVYASTEVGKQVLLYPVKISERMADICKRHEYNAFDRIVEAQRGLDILSAEKYIGSLHEAGLDKLNDELILQLFYKRLVGENNRYQQFYAGHNFEFPDNLNIKFEQLATLKWRVNGVEYKETLGDAFAKALKNMAPEAHLLPGKKTYAAVVAHGDAHNGNVWFNNAEPAYLSLFDPAFAGLDIPALLAEIKATFHNIFAHPLWLYDSLEADSTFEISAKINGGFIDVTHNWKLSPLRVEFLNSKRDLLWKPLLNELKSKNLLAPNWQEYMRSALFCCPTLVMNLRANAGNSRNYHTAKTSLLGLAISIMLSSAPAGGKDVVSEFFAQLAL